MRNTFRVISFGKRDTFKRTSICIAFIMTILTIVYTRRSLPLHLLGEQYGEIEF